MSDAHRCAVRNFLTVHEEDLLPDDLSHEETFRHVRHTVLQLNPATAPLNTKTAGGTFDWEFLLNVWLLLCMFTLYANSPSHAATQNQRI